VRAVNKYRNLNFNSRWRVRGKNLTQDMAPWNEVGYKWVEVRSTDRARVWICRLRCQGSERHVDRHYRPGGREPGARVRRYRRGCFEFGIVKAWTGQVSISLFEKGVISERKIVRDTYGYRVHESLDEVWTKMERAGLPPRPEGWNFCP